MSSKRAFRTAVTFVLAALILPGWFSATRGLEWTLRSMQHSNARLLGNPIMIAQPGEANTMLASPDQPPDQPPGQSTEQPPAGLPAGLASTSSPGEWVVDAAASPEIAFPDDIPGPRIDEPSGSRGPRVLPETFVNLEVASFSRPTVEACADNTSIIEVRPGDRIIDALDRATPGATVLVAGGTYVENVDSYVALPWNTDNVCLRARSGETVVLQAAPGQSYGMSFTGDDVVIEGFTLRNFGSSVSLWTGEGATQRNVTLERVRIENPAGAFRDGIVAYGDNQSTPGLPPTLDGLTLIDVSVDGTDLGVSCNSGPCSHWWIESTSVTGRGGTGGSGADTFAIEDGRQIVVIDSTFANATADGIDTKASDVVVLRTLVHDVRRNGLKGWRGMDVLNTVVDGSGADAALVGDEQGRYRYAHVLVRRHSPGGTGYVGTWGYDSNARLSLEIVNSIFVGNATGGMYVPTGANLSVRNSIFADFDAKLFDLGAVTYLVTQLAAFEAAGYGSANRVADPQLVAPDASNYTTRPGSPARDAGLPITSLATDMCGNPRSLGAGPDIGPLESG